MKVTKSGDGWPHVIIVDPFSGGLALARTMHRLGARVTIICERASCEGATRSADWVAQPYDADGEAWLAALGCIAKSGQDLVAIPCTDRASYVFARHPDRLPPNVRCFEAQDSAHLRLMNKESAEVIARRAGVPVPWTATIHNVDELHDALAVAPWPCVVKPTLTHEWRERYSMLGPFQVAGAEAAAQALERPVRDGMTMLLCQYIPGGDDHVEEAIVVRLADGSYPVRFGVRKLRQYPRGFGTTALGESSEIPETMTLAQRVLDEAGFVGVAGVETKRDAQTGQRWFLEVNVRAPAQWGLGDASGVDASRRLIAALCGRRMGPPPPLRSGVRFVLPMFDLLLLLERMREVPASRRPAVATRFLRPWFGAGEKGLLDLRDPWPAVEFVRLRAGRRLRARLRPSLAGPSPQSDRGDGVNALPTTMSTRAKQAIASGQEQHL